MMIFNISLFAQGGYRLSGTILDGDKMPIPGANVNIANTTKGSSTDIDGKFQIDVKKGDVLEFSYIGYKKQSVTISAQKSLTISLVENSSELDEVVVVGYGTRKKSHLTGSIAKIGGDDVAAVQATRVDEALGGKLSGVRIQNQSGEPGAAPKIQIRAASSISGNSDPLVVVDGFPISGSLATVNPNDIESIEVLKDAASSAIYGSRGANGVVLITTKKGKAGKTSFSYNAYTSLSNKYTNDNLNMDANQWGAHLEAGIADGTYDLSRLTPAQLNVANYRINAYKNAPDVVNVEDWLFRTGASSSHDFSVSGGTEDVKFFGSLGYQNTEGVALNQDFEKLNARMNIDASLGDKFKTGLSFNGFTSDRSSLGWDMRDLLRASSISPIYHTAASIAFVQDLNNQAVALGLANFNSGNRSGNTFGYSTIAELQPGMAAQDWHYGRALNGIGSTGDAGPASKLDNTDRWEKTYFANVTTYLQYSIIEGLNIKTVLGGDFNDTQNYYWRGLESDSQARVAQTNLNNAYLKKSSVLSETTLNYAKEFGKHDVSAVAGVEFQNTFFKGVSLNGTNVPYGDIINYNLLAPADITTVNTDQHIARKSVFGRVNYAYDDRYLLSVSVRRDGDSRFGANQKYATFPAVSLGWNVHKEAFFKENEVLNLLKLRFSRGSLGTTSFLGAYDALSVLTVKPTALGTGYLIPANVANEDLTWQTNTETNFGIDTGFLNNRIKLSVDYYTSDINDILIKQPKSEVLGISTLNLNSGNVRSSGLEFELSASIINSNDFSWSINTNLSTVNTEIKSLGGLEKIADTRYGVSGRAPVFRNYVGGNIGEMWGIQTLGVVEDKYIKDPTVAIGVNSSAYYVKDQNGDGKIDITKTVAEGGDLVKMGKNTPDFYWGMSQNFKYKKLDVSFQLQGSHGAKVWNVDPIYYQSQFGGLGASGKLGGVINSVDTNGDGVADVGPNAGNIILDANNPLDAFMQDASYVALRNLTIGYTLNKDLVSKIGLSSVRVYGAATNLLYLWAKNYTSLNPEGVYTEDSTQAYLGPITYGVQNGASPVVRSFTVGLNVNF
ncbi:SusC/RagA family TonB-linked outer membrane protein [Flavobacterium algicola]|uniref:SusC/RagA family TonB-linked outer membrane protein n=1 Tax=Flavobacterium algicola TaxID=556529 RepID=UPI001EFCC660|nr:TonB-dependent receptor [Flavobacterium algicola]MCG9791791.1 TonB-dependent receptor [Flavobacterium algicola]